MATECTNCGRTDSFLWPHEPPAGERDRLCDLCWELRGVLEIARDPQRSADVIRS